MKAEAELLLDFYKKHPGKLGEAREIILQNFFSTYLPKSLSVGSGFTLISDTLISTEQDIIIFDALHSPVLFPNNRSAIYPHTAVRCLIEVKSNLSKQEIEKSVRKAQLVKQAWREAPISPMAQSTSILEPLVCLFGFNGPELKVLKESIIEVQKEIAEQDRLDLTCLLGSGILSSGSYFNVSIFGQENSPYKKDLTSERLQMINSRYPNRLKCFDFEDNALLVFYYWMTSYIMHMPPLFPDLIKYAPSDMEWGSELH